MDYHQSHFHRYILVSGIVLGLLVTGGYKANASSRAANSNAYNSNHMVIAFSNSTLAHNRTVSQKNRRKQPVNPKRSVRNNLKIVPRRTVSKYYRVLNGMNHYYNRAKVAKPDEITSSHRYVKQNLPSLSSKAATSESTRARSASSVHDKHYRQSFHQPISGRNSHLIISFATPDQQSYPVKAESENNRSRRFSNYAKDSVDSNRRKNQSGTRLNPDTSAVNNQVGDWFRDGLTDSELNARNWISWRESNNRWNVLSYGGYCAGYFQLSPRYLGYVNGHLNLDHQHQVQAADHYTKSKYGSWSAAKRFWLGHRWY